MTEALPVDAVALRDEVRAKYRDVAVNPHGTFHFHTGRPLARRLGYDEAVVARMPESAIEAFAGVGNPFSQGCIEPRRAGGRSRVGWRLRLLCCRRTGRGRGSGRRRGYDRRNAPTLPCGSVRNGPRQRRVPAGSNRGFASRGWLGRCRHQQRRHQPLRRQTPGFRRDHAGAAPRRSVAFRGHRNRQDGAGSGCSAISTCGPTELPVACRAQAGGVYWEKAGSFRSTSARQLTPLGALAGRARLDCSRSSAMRS